MVYIAIVSAFVLAAFIVLVVDLAKMILKALRKEKFGRKLVASTIAFTAAWAILGCLNLVLILNALSKGDPVIDKVLSGTADIASKSLVYTFEGIQKNWDKDTLAKASQIDFSIVASSRKDSDDKKNTVYEYKLLLNNRLDRAKAIDYWDLQSQNLLFALDANDVFFAARPTDTPSSRIPMGKSYLTIEIVVPAFTTLKELGLGEKKIKL